MKKKLKKSLTEPKILKKDRYCMLRGKLFWFSSQGQRVQFVDVFLRFCRSFGVELFWSLQVYRKTRRERPKSAPYLRLKNIQGTTIVKIWKKNFSKKLFLKFFFEKKYFLVAKCRKTQKKAIQAHSTFSTNRKFQKKCKGVPFDKFQKFSKKSRTVPKKIQRGDPLGTSGCVCFLEKVKTERGTLWSKVCLLRRIAEL